MLNNQPHVLELAALLKEHGVRHYVLCPGSRDIPLIQTMTQIPEFSCRPVTDERSAGFIALGTANSTGEPCAVVVTSGSSLLNLHPAVAEAFYQKRPLLIISADRPAAWIGQMDGQTLRQEGVFAGLATFEGSLPAITDGTSHWHCNRMINEALIALRRHSRPVHINVPIAEPFFACNTPELPKVRVIRELSLGSLAEKLSGFSRPWLVLGQNPCGKQIPPESLKRLSDRFAVVAEHLSNASLPEVVSRMDMIAGAMTKDQAKAFEPDAVVYLGGHIVSKQTKKFLRSVGCPQFLVAESEPLSDLLQNLVGVVFAPFEEGVETLLACPEHKNQFGNLRKAQKLASQVIAANLSDGDNQLALTGRVIEAIPSGSVLHLANSSTVRYAQYFDVSSCSIRTEVNRGVNGIEGSLSEAVGAALADPGRLHFLLIGDLSFFYDMNALALAPSNLRIALFNNGGGEIFGALPGLSLAPKARSIVSAYHDTKARGWAGDCGATYVKIEDSRSLAEALTAFVDPSEGLRLLEIFTSMPDDLKALASLNKELRSAFQSTEFN